jgi:hypothetical protein
VRVSVCFAYKIDQINCKAWEEGSRTLSGEELLRALPPPRGRAVCVEYIMWFDVCKWIQMLRANCDEQPKQQPRWIFIIKPTRCTNFSNLFLELHVPSWSCSQAVSRPVWHTPVPCVQWKTPDVGQRNCPKHVEFYSKNKFEKLVHLVCFVMRIATYFEKIYDTKTYSVGQNAKLFSVIAASVYGLPCE